MDFYLFHSPIILEVSGPHATRYLNARLSNDIKSLSPGKFCLAAALTPQGATQGLFAVLRLGDQEFTLVGDAGQRDQVIAAVKKYIVADRVSVKDVSDAWRYMHVSPLHEATEFVSSVLGLQLSESDEFSFSRNESGLVWTRSRTGAPGFDLLLEPMSAGNCRTALLEAGARELTETQYEYARISCATPSYPQELHEDALFSEATLDGVVSFRKGCYVGQEVVEKVDARGKLSRSLRVLRLSCDKAPEVGERVTLDRDGILAEIGQLVSLGYDSETQQAFCFARIKNDPALIAGIKVRVGGYHGELL